MKAKTIRTINIEDFKLDPHLIDYVDENLIGQCRVDLSRYDARKSGMLYHRFLHGRKCKYQHQQQKPRVEHRPMCHYIAQHGYPPFT